SDLFGNLDVDGQTYDLGNTVSNANRHNINSTLNMNKFYNYIGLKKKTIRRISTPSARTTPDGKPKESSNKKPAKAKNGGQKLANVTIDILTSLKRVQVNYSETNGTYLPGYLRTPGFIGTLKPTVGFTFGSQKDVRHLAAKNGWLTLYPDFNEQYTAVKTQQLDYSANIEPLN